MTLVVAAVDRCVVDNIQGLSDQTIKGTKAFVRNGWLFTCAGSAAQGEHLATIIRETIDGKKSRFISKFGADYQNTYALAWHPTITDRYYTANVTESGNLVVADQFGTLEYGNLQDTYRILRKLHAFERHPGRPSSTVSMRFEDEQEELLALAHAELRFRVLVHPEFALSVFQRYETGWTVTTIANGNVQSLPA